APRGRRARRDRPHDRRPLPARHGRRLRSATDRAPARRDGRPHARGGHPAPARGAIPVAARARPGRGARAARRAPVRRRTARDRARGGAVRGLLLPFALLAALPSWLHLPTWAERWLYNPRERTTSALAEEKKGKPQDAVAPLETAARLAGDDP